MKFEEINYIKKGKSLIPIGIVLIIIGFIPILTNFAFNIEQEDSLAPEKITYIAYSTNNAQLQDTNFNTDKYAYIGKSQMDVQYITILSFDFTYLSITDIRDLTLVIDGNFYFWLPSINSFFYGISLYTFEEDWNTENFIWNDMASLSIQPMDYFGLSTDPDQQIIFQNTNWLEELKSTGKINIVLEIDNYPLEEDTWMTYNFEKENIYISYINGYLNNQATFITFGIIESIGIIVLITYFLINKRK